MSNSIANTVTTNILPVQALYDPTTLQFITFIGPAGLPFTSAAGGVSSVNVSGGTTGLTYSGGPIVSSGTITMSGTLAVTNGGTGATTSADALTNLLPSQTGNSGKYLTTNGTTTSWATVGSGLTISTDTTTNASRYLTFTSTTNGVITSENVSTALYFNPSSGSLTATTFVGALTGNASTATSATTSTNLAGGANGSLPYQTGSGATTFLAAGTNGQYLTLSGGVPTWSNLTYVSSFSAGTTGFTPSVSTTGAVTLSGTLNVANGGTGVTSSSGANSVVLRDTNSNATANAFFAGFTSVAASGTQINLTASSTPVYVITGTGGQVIKLPDATTLPKGPIYSFNNNQSSGAITVNNNSGTLVVSVPSGGYTTVVLLDNSTSAGTWDRHDETPSNVSWSTNTLSYPGSITSATWNGTAIGAIYGGTGQTTYTTGDTLYASATNTLSKLAIGSTGQVLTVAGGVPTWSTPASGASITDDTTTNATRYINFTSATTGTLSTLYTSSTKLQYNPSTGALSVPQIGIGTSSPSYSLDIVNNQNANTVASITNNNAGTTAQAIFYTANGSSLTQFGTTGTGYTAYGSLTANSGYLYSTAPNFVLMANNASSPIIFASGGNSEKMRLDTSGNLGLGVTPSAWGGNITKGIEFTNSGYLVPYTSATYSNMYLGTNAYFNGTNWIYKNNNYAAQYQLTDSGQHQWKIAPSSTGTITFTQAMTLDNSGKLGIGITSPTYPLHVSTGAQAGSMAFGNDAYGVFQKSSSEFRFWSRDTTPLTFLTNDFERMRIDSSGNVGIGTTTTTAAQLTVNGTASIAGLKVPNIKEVATVSATASTGTINYDITTQSVLYYTTNASGNFTLNFRGSSGTSLNTLMATGESMTVVFMCTNGTTAYYNSAVQVDGSAVTPKWQGGTAPSAGNASSIDTYTYTIIKTASATYTVLASLTQFK